jgi:hypothetical protein
LDEKEVRTWKTVNEKRAEKGLDPIDLSKVENPADLPMNVQLVQLFQSQQAQDGMGGDMGDLGGGEDGGFDEGGEDAGIEETETETEEEFPPDTADMNKSIQKSMLII